MAANDSWADFENLRHTVKHNTVDKLKQILSGFNEQCNTSFHKSGKKQDLIDRVVFQMDTWRRENNVDKWTKAHAVLNQVRRTGMYVCFLFASPTVVACRTMIYSLGLMLSMSLIMFCY
ncbi:hypothetical protein EDD17DRAFT_592712 [Pisolithus thermaeus]|nr:hypothetical protein EDD17DRAFT_592712 [Pisolithus thermaeus]